MYKGKTISVAIATYNGEKYIEEQLLSICRNTVKPDEIVISDDGSNDRTLDIAAKVSASEDAAGIRFLIRTDNKRKGYCGNFEHALKHTSGDYIFLSDQDDVWMRNKIQYVADVFLSHPDAGLVYHEKGFINGYGNKITPKDQSPESESGSASVIWIERATYLTGAISTPVANGMCMCISRALLFESLPFPESSGSHDHWLGFVAVANNVCYCLCRILTSYRLHGENTTGNSIYKGSLTKRVKRIIKKIRNLGKQNNETYILGQRMVEYLNSHPVTDELSLQTAMRVLEVGEALHEAEQKGRIAGSLEVIRLYKNDIRYRRMGWNQYVLEILYLLLIDPRRRRENS